MKLSKIQSAIYTLNERYIDNKFKLKSSITYSQLYKNLLEEQVSGVHEMGKQATKSKEVLRSPALHQIVEQSTRMKKIKILVA